MCNLRASSVSNQCELHIVHWKRFFGASGMGPAGIFKLSALISGGSSDFIDLGNLPPSSLMFFGIASIGGISAGIGLRSGTLGALAEINAIWWTEATVGGPFLDSLNEHEKLLCDGIGTGTGGTTSRSLASQVDLVAAIGDRGGMFLANGEILKF